MFSAPVISTLITHYFLFSYCHIPSLLSSQPFSPHLSNITILATPTTPYCSDYIRPICLPSVSSEPWSLYKVCILTGFGKRASGRWCICVCDIVCVDFRTKIPRTFTPQTFTPRTSYPPNVYFPQQQVNIKKTIIK